MSTTLVWLALVISALACCQYASAQASEGVCRRREPPKRYPDKGVDGAVIAVLVITPPVLLMLWFWRDRIVDFILFSEQETPVEELLAYDSSVQEDGGNDITVPDGCKELSFNDFEVVVEDFSVASSGVVHLCKDMRAGGVSQTYCLLRSLNLKMEGSGDNERARALFQRDIRTLAPVSHQNIVEFLGIIKPSPAFDYTASVLEYPPFGKLDKYLRCAQLGDTVTIPVVDPSKAIDSPYSITQTTLLRFAKDICTAVAYIHSQGIVHKDIAARQCFVDSNLTVKLCLYELHVQSQNWEYKPPTGFRSYFGAYRWMSPEMLEGLSTPTPKSDIWSLCVTLWEVFSKGEKPYANLTAQEVETHVLMEGHTLSAPDFASEGLFKYMHRGWAPDGQLRPTAEELGTFIGALIPNDTKEDALTTSKQSLEATPNAPSSSNPAPGTSAAAVSLSSSSAIDGGPLTVASAFDPAQATPVSASVLDSHDNSPQSTPKAAREPEESAATAPVTEGLFQRLSRKEKSAVRQLSRDMATSLDDGAMSKRLLSDEETVPGGFPPHTEGDRTAAVQVRSPRSYGSTGHPVGEADGDLEYQVTDV